MKLRDKPARLKDITRYNNFYEFGVDNGLVLAGLLGFRGVMREPERRRQLEAGTPAGRKIIPIKPV